MARVRRVAVDCRDFPNENNCSLYISGNLREVMKASLRHAVEEHGHKDTKELRKQLNAMLKPEAPVLKKKKGKQK